jgi:hypothetical protein
MKNVEMNKKSAVSHEPVHAEAKIFPFKLAGEVASGLH